MGLTISTFTFSFANDKIPLYSLPDPTLKAPFRIIAQQLPGLADIGVAVFDVAVSVRCEDGFDVFPQGPAEFIVDVRFDYYNIEATESIPVASSLSLY